MNNVSNNFVITALLNGTTINGSVRVDNLPLVQRYKTGTNQFVPDFDALAENAKPVAFPLLMFNDTGTIATPSSVTFKYNGIVLTFDAAGLSTNGSMVGVFKKITYPFVVGGTTYQIAALRVMKNLVPLSSYDNDLLSINGTVELGGQQIPFAEMNKEVIIEESVGNQYDVVITNTKGSQLLTPTDSLTETVTIYKDSVVVSDLTGFSFKWYKLSGLGDVLFGGTTRTQTIAATDVDNVQKIRCDVLQGGSVVASGYDEITDFSDPYDVRFDVTGSNGTQLSQGETATITPKVVKRSTGDVVTGFSFSFNTKNNAGQDFILTGKSTDKFTAANALVSYADVIRAGRALKGFVNATK